MERHGRHSTHRSGRSSWGDGGVTGGFTVPEPLFPVIQWMSIAVIAVAVGMIVARGSLPITGVLLLAPVAMLSAVVVLRNPLLLGMLLLPIFYSNIEGITGEKTGLPTAVALWLLSLGYFAVLAFTNQLRFLMPLSSKLFLLFIAVITAMATLIPYRNDALYSDWLKMTLYSLNAYLMCHVVLINRTQIRRLVILLTWTGVVLSVINIIEFFDRSLINLSSVPARSAGLLQNANPSASAILACYLISYLTPQRFMLPARLLMFLGIYTTFSRAGLIMFFLFLFYSELVAQSLTVRRLVVSALLIVTALTVLAFGRVLVEQSNNKQVSLAYERIVRTLDGSFDDESSNQRRRVIPIHLKLFEEHPLVGSGGGATRGPDSPHNQILIIMVEHGLIGTILFLIFVGVACRGILVMPRVPEKRLLLALFLFQVANMSVTHNELQYRFYMVVFALICVGPQLYSEREFEEADKRLPQPQKSGAMVRVGAHRRQLPASRFLPARGELQKEEA